MLTSNRLIVKIACVMDIDYLWYEHVFFLVLAGTSNFDNHLHFVLYCHQCIYGWWNHHGALT